MITTAKERTKWKQALESLSLYIDIEECLDNVALDLISDIEELRELLRKFVLLFPDNMEKTKCNIPRYIIDEAKELLKENNNGD